MGQEKFAPYTSDIAADWSKTKQETDSAWGRNTRAETKKWELEPHHSPLLAVAPPPARERTSVQPFKRGHRLVRDSSIFARTSKASTLVEYSRPGYTAKEDYSKHKNHLTQQVQPLGRGWSNVPATRTPENCSANQVSNQSKEFQTSSSVMRQRQAEVTSKNVSKHRTRVPIARRRGKWC